MKRLLIVGEDGFVVAAMRVALRYTPDLAVIGVRSRDGSVRRAVREARPDIVLLDGSRESSAVLERLAHVTEERTGAIVLVVATALDARVLDEILEAGATVCISRTGIAERVEGLLRGAIDVAQPTAAPEGQDAPAVPRPQPERPGGPRLTSRELEILRCVAKGHTNARIGRDLWVTEQTVKFHLSNVYRKLGVSNRTEASRYVLLNNLLPEAERAANGHHPDRPVADSVQVRRNGHGDPRRVECRVGEVG